ncbi:MAG: hypothetical protein RR416_01250 [Clostridia bacterium]
MRYYKIAEKTLAIEFADKQLESFCQNYQLQEVPQAVDMDICVETTLSITAESEQPTACANGVRIFQKEEKRVVCYGNPIRARVECSNDYSKVSILIARSDDPFRPDKMVEYMMLGQYFYDMLTLNDGLMLHGSAIAVNGSGVVFTAPCGTGKSTHSRLWQETFGKEVVVVNDDKPAIIFGDIIKVAGTPFCGKEGINANVTAPLKAIVYLKQAKTNSMRQVSGKEALFCLYEQIQMNVIDKRLIPLCAQKLTQILASVPVFVLECLPDQQAVELCRATIGI